MTLMHAPLLRQEQSRFLEFVDLSLRKICGFPLHVTFHWQFMTVFESGFGFPYCSRKGSQCARLVIEGFLEGMTFTDEDLIVWLDVVPNKHLGLVFIGKCF